MKQYYLLYVFYSKRPQYSLRFWNLSFTLIQIIEGNTSIKYVFRLMFYFLKEETYFKIKPHRFLFFQLLCVKHVQTCEDRLKRDFCELYVSTHTDSSNSYYPMIMEKKPKNILSKIFFLTFSVYDIHKHNITS